MNTQKTEDCATQTPLKTRGELKCPIRLAVPALTGPPHECR